MKSNKSTISLYFLSTIKAEEPANFLAAPAPDFFPSGSGSFSCFFQAAPAQGSQKHAAPAPQPCFLLLCSFFYLFSSFYHW